MARSDAIEAEAARLFAAFQAQGAVPVSADVLQPADTLLDLYGEDIRARAYVTSDPVLGEQMLRPDFTVPVVLAHMRDGAEPARYTYCGTVFRRQEAGSGRAREYTQVGYEVFDGSDTLSADAEVFSLMSQALAGHDVRAVIGDIGLLVAAVAGLSTSGRRRAALMRHIWRPRRFRALLERFSGQGEMPVGRADILDLAGRDDVVALVRDAGPEIGLRSVEDVLARLATLKDDAEVAPIPEDERAALLAILDLKADLGGAVTRLQAIAKDYPAIAQAVDRFARRAVHLASETPFEGAYGRGSMEYYDGFVFGFYAAGQEAPVATGGRYDALTRRLGNGRSIPAVGAVIRPDLLVGAAP